VVSARAGFVVGADIGGTNVRVAAADLFGEAICDLKHPTAKDGGRAVGVQILEMVSEVIDRAGAVHGRPLALGISSPGIVDQRSGRVTSLAYNVVPEGGFDPLEVIRDRFDLPVFVENNVNLAAVG
jgi:predicted NBD/HSP70 family sugar kinase